VYCLSCPEPSYPLLARTRGWEGAVDVGLAVRSDGSVDRVVVRRSSGHDVLDRAAVAAAQASRFRTPAANASAKVIEGYIQYRFKLAQKRE